MSDLDELLTPEAANWLLSAAVRDLTTQTRRNGGTMPAFAEAVLAGLAARSDRSPPPVCSVGGTAPDSVNEVMRSCLISAADAADSTGVSVEYVRRLAREGRVRRERLGRIWLVDVESLRTVLGRTAA